MTDFDNGVAQERQRIVSILDAAGHSERGLDCVLNSSDAPRRTPAPPIEYETELEHGVLTERRRVTDILNCSGAFSDITATLAAILNA